MNKHIGFPGERIILNVEVLTSEDEETDYGIICHYTLKTEDGDILYWKASRDTKRLSVGQTYHIKLSIRMHDEVDGIKKTIVSHVVEYKEPTRIPRVAIGVRTGFRR